MGWRLLVLFLNDFGVLGDLGFVREFGLLLREMFLFLFLFVKNDCKFDGLLVGFCCDCW